jgi:hypothetical protein
VTVEKEQNDPMELKIEEQQIIPIENQRILPVINTSSGID